MCGMRNKISSRCLFAITLKQALAMHKQENMPRECPLPGCRAAPWFLNMKTHFARCHPTVPPNTLNLM